jgi:diguanylate cyclase (GGDEF)-like protein
MDTHTPANAVRDGANGGLEEAARAEQLRAEQLRLLVENRGDRYAGLLSAALVVFVVRGLYPGWVLAGWFVLCAALVLVRGWAPGRWRAADGGLAPGARAVRRRLHLATAAASAAGVLLGLAASAVLLTPNPAVPVFILLMLGGSMAGGVLGNAAWVPAMAGFALPTILPCIIALAARPGGAYLGLAGLQVFYGLIVLNAGLKVNRIIIDNIRLRLAQSGWLDRLIAGEAALAEAQTLAQAGSWQIDPKTGAGVLSAQARAIFGVELANPGAALAAGFARIHPQDRPAFERYVAESARSPAAMGIDLRLLMADGAVKFIHETRRTVQDAGGGILRISGSVQDITRRRVAEQKLQFAKILLETQMEASPDGIMVVDVGNRGLKSFNRRFGEIWRIPPSLLWAGNDDVIRRHIRGQVKHPAAYAARVDYLLDHPGELGDDEIETTDGRFIERHGAPLRGTAGELLGHVRFFRDVTRRRRDAEIIAYRDRLLNAVTAATSVAVQAVSLAVGVPAALRTIGESMGVQRVVVMQDTPDAQFLLHFVWERAGIAVPFRGAGARFDPASVAAWRRPLRDGRPVFADTRTATGAVRAMLAHYQAQAILLMPVHVAGGVWGFVGVEDSAAARRWTASEVETLRILADVAGSLIVRERAGVALATSEAKLNFANVMLRTQMEASPDGIIAVNAEGRIVSFNRRYARMLNIPMALLEAGDVLPVRAAIAAGMADPPGFLARVLQLLANPGENGDDELETADGRRLERHSRTLQSAGAENLGRVWFYRDITARRNAEAMALRQARVDGLTGLANRAMFLDAIDQSIANAGRGAGGFAVLYLDLDHFKEVNDSHGHPAGDALLLEVARRLRANTRETDTVARLGGDEFAIIAADIKDPSDAALLAEKLIKSIGLPFRLAGLDLHKRASVGIDMFSTRAADAETLISHADTALYRAKAEGRGTYRFFTPAMDRDVHRRIELAAELRAGIAAGQLFLLYQPQVDAATGRILGVEALVRWRHPARGVLAPEQFIAIAESAGLIGALGRFVLAAACRQGRAWADAGLPATRIGVNISALQFKSNEALEADIVAALAASGLPPALLELELPETVLMETSRRHDGVIARLRALGVGLAISDFGTGHSSFEYLRRCSFNHIKIARSFTEHLETEAGDAAVVRGIIGLARELNISVIAEGVASQAQLDLLMAWGCTRIQGFHISRPRPPEAIAALLRTGGAILPAP